MNKKSLSRYLIFVSVFTFITIFVLIVQKSYSNLVGTVKQVKTSGLGKPINPQLDEEVLKLIVSKEEISPESASFVPTPTLTFAPTPTTNEP